MSAVKIDFGGDVVPIFVLKIPLHMAGTRGPKIGKASSS